MTFFILGTTLALDILSRLETCVVDKKDNVTLVLAEYLDLDLSVKDAELTAKLFNVDPDSGQRSTESTDFLLEVKSRYQYDNKIMEYYLIMYNFQMKKETCESFRKYELEFTITYNYPDKPSITDSVSMNIDVRVIDVENLTEAAKFMLEGTYYYNPNITSEFLMSYKNGLPLSLDYDFKCVSLNGTIDDNTPTLTLNKPQIVDHEDWSRSNKIVRDDSNLNFVGGYLVELNHKMGYIKIFDYQSPKNYRIIKGFKIKEPCEEPDFYDVKAGEIMLICTSFKKISFYYYQVRGDVVYNDHLEFVDKYSQCSFSKSGHSVSCLFNIDPVTENISDPSPTSARRYNSLDVYQVETNPLLLTLIRTFDDKKAIELYRKRTNKFDKIMTVDFIHVTPCPKIATTVVIYSVSEEKECQKMTDKGCEDWKISRRVLTIHLDTRPNEDEAVLLSWHNIQDVEQVPKDNEIMICGFKANMLVYNTLSNETFAEAVVYNKQFFPLKYTQGRKILSHICMSDLGFFAVLVGDETASPDVPKNTNTLVVFSGNDAFSATARLFAVHNVSSDHNDLFYRYQYDMGIITFYTRKLGGAFNISRFSQSLTYPRFEITTYGTGNYNCSVKMKERVDEELPEAKTYTGGETCHSYLTISVRGWLDLQIKRNSTQDLEFDVSKAHSLNLEEEYKFEGPFFSAEIDYKDSSLPENFLSIYPRYQPIRSFGLNNFGSDYSQLVIYDDKLFFGFSSSRIDCLYLQSKRNITFDDLKAKIPMEDYQIVGEEGFGYQILATDVLTDDLNSDVVDAVAIFLNVTDDKDQPDDFGITIVSFDQNTARMMSKTASLKYPIPKGKVISDMQMQVFNISKEPNEPHLTRTYKLIISYVDNNLTEIIVTNTTINITHGLPKDQFVHVNSLVHYKTFDRYSMKSVHFEIDRYYLKSYNQHTFTMEILSNEELMVVTFCIMSPSTSKGYSSYSLSKFSDVSHSFDCCPDYGKCIITFKGGTMIEVGFKLEKPTNESEIYRFNKELANYTLPTRFPLTNIRIGLDYIIGYNFEYEDYIMVYKKETMKHLFVSFKKAYGVSQIVRLIHGIRSKEVNRPDMLVMTYGKDYGQVFVFRDLSLYVNQNVDSDVKINKLEVVLNSFGENEDRYSSTHKLVIPLKFDTNSKLSWPKKLLIFAIVLFFSAVLVGATAYLYKQTKKKKLADAEAYGTSDDLVHIRTSLKRDSK